MIMVTVLALAAGGAAGKDLTETQLLEAATATGREAPKAGKLGTFNGTPVVVEVIGETRVIKYDVKVSQCADVEGVVRSIAMPTGTTGTLLRFCVPAVLMGKGAGDSNSGKESK